MDKEGKEEALGTILPPEQIPFEEEEERNLLATVQVGRPVEVDQE